MKSKFIWIAIVLVFGGFIINNHYKQASRHAVEDAETDRIQREVKAAISQVVTRHNAISDWEKTLSNGNSYRMSPILTIELEKLWQSDHPILFIGSIKDISTISSD